MPGSLFNDAAVLRRRHLYRPIITSVRHATFLQFTKRVCETRKRLLNLYERQ